MNPSLNGRDASSNSGKTSTHFYKLPHVGRFSKIAQTKLRQLLKHYCKADFKLRNMFSVKDSVMQGLRSRVVYKFSCAGCNASYIGETTRHLYTRAREHLLSDRSSHAYRYLQSSRACHDSYNSECFTICRLKIPIKIKEALQIKRENPILNEQLRHLDLSLSF